MARKYYLAENFQVGRRSLSSSTDSKLHSCQSVTGAVPQIPPGMVFLRRKDDSFDKAMKWELPKQSKWECVRCRKEKFPAGIGGRTETK